MLKTIPTIDKGEERQIVEAIASIVMPHSPQLETYGIGACIDLLHAWARAIDCDMPLECFARDKIHAESCRREAEKGAARVLGIAKAEADMIVESARKSAARIVDRARESMRHAIKELDS
jgi:ribosomal protein L40E